MTRPRRLLGVDIYSFDFKISHIARHIRLPDAPPVGPAALARPPERRVPPLLLINVQLPMYPVRMSVRYRHRQSQHAVRSSEEPLLGRMALALWAVLFLPCKVGRE